MSTVASAASDIATGRKALGFLSRYENFIRQPLEDRFHQEEPFITTKVTKCHKGKQRVSLCILSPSCSLVTLVVKFLLSKTKKH
jgi:hypothetical protein